MFGFLRSAKPAETLVEKTPLSAFVRDATSGEKKQVYKRVLEKATAEQNDLLRTVAEATRAQAASR